MSLWHETLILDGDRIDPNITDQVTGALLVRTMDGAESLELTVSDPDMKLLRSGALSKKGKPSTRQQQLKEAAWERFAQMRLALDGVLFRFAGVQLNYDQPPWSIVLTFESEVATVMRLADKFFKAPRGKQTRVQFIANMWLRAQPNRQLPSSAFYGANFFDKQPIAKSKDADRNKGISPNAHLTIKGYPITAEQRKQLEVSLSEAEAQNASERVMLAMLCAGIGESGFKPIMNAAGSGYGGVFQGDVTAHYRYFKVTDTKGMAHYFLVGGKGFQAGGAIKLAAANPDMTPGGIATRVEASGEADGFYDANRQEADAILAAWGGAVKTVTVRESFEYRAGALDKTTGRRENYWDASGRLVDEVRWRRFATRNALWVGPDEWFFKNQPAFVINGSKKLADQGVLGFTGNIDIGMPVSELPIRVFTPRWTASPGTVFEFEDMGPLTGRYLIWENRMEITASVEIAELTLRRPAPTKKEPAPGTRTRTVGPAETPGDLAYPLARRGTFIQGPGGAGTHSHVLAPNNWQSDDAIDVGVPVGTSVFAVDDGVISPPGTPYSGFGDTGEGGRFAGKRLHLKTAQNAWYYAHLSEISVKAGDEVKKGDLLGKSGAANGVAHLHIAVERGNPKTMLGW